MLSSKRASTTGSVAIKGRWGIDDEVVAVGMEDRGRKKKKSIMSEFGW